MSVSVCVCPALHFLRYFTDLDVTLGNGKGCPLVVHFGQICNRCTGFVAMATYTYVYKTIRYRFDTVCLLDSTLNCCNLVWDGCLCDVSAELFANVSVLRGLLLFRDGPNTDTCYHPF